MSAGDTAPVEHAVIGGKGYAVSCPCGTDTKFFHICWSSFICRGCQAVVNNPHEALSSLLDAFLEGRAWQGSAQDVEAIARSLGATGGR